MKLKLPKYVQQRPRKNGPPAFAFRAPAHIRPENWNPYIPLSDDVGEMFRQAADLYARLRSERTGRAVRGHIKGSFPWLLEKYQQSPRYKDLAPATKELYDYCAENILTWSKRGGHASVKPLTRPHVLKFLEQFDSMPTKKKKNYIFIRLLLSYACDLGIIEINPATNLRVKDPEVQVHIWTASEVDDMIAKADELGMRSIGTAVLLAVETAQRQGDVLTMKYGLHYKEGRFLFKQNKTKELMGFPATEKLKLRLASAEIGYIVPAAEGKKFARRDFINKFTRVRDAAGLKHCKFQTLRHTAIVRLARAGCSHSQIASISGHSEASAAYILQRYLPRDSEVAAGAILKLENSRIKVGN
jgi:integrase